MGQTGASLTLPYLYHLHLCRLVLCPPLLGGLSALLGCLQRLLTCPLLTWLQDCPPALPFYLLPK